MNHTILYMIFFIFIILFYNKMNNSNKIVDVEIDDMTKNLLNDGYLIIPNMLTHQDCDNILKDIHDVEKRNPKTSSIHANTNRKDMLMPVYRVKNHIQKIYNKTKNIWDVVTPNPMLCECSTLISYPGAKHQSWHSDTEYNPNDANLVSIGIVLSDVTKRMGPLHVLKGSNNEHGKMSVENILNNKNHAEIHCTAKKGDAVIWLSSVVHRGSKNTSKKSRAVFYFSLLGNNGNKPNGATYSLLNNKKNIYMEDGL